MCLKIIWHPWSLSGQLWPVAIINSWKLIHLTLFLSFYTLSTINLTLLLFLFPLSLFSQLYQVTIHALPIPKRSLVFFFEISDHFLSEYSQTLPYSCLKTKFLLFSQPPPSAKSVRWNHLECFDSQPQLLAKSSVLLNSYNS